MYDYSVSVNGCTEAVAKLDEGDQIRITDGLGRVLEGEVTYAPDQRQFDDRIVRKFLNDDSRAVLGVPLDPEGGLIDVDVEYDGQIASVHAVEIDSE